MAGLSQPSGFKLIKAYMAKYLNAAVFKNNNHRILSGNKAETYHKNFERKQKKNIFYFLCFDLQQQKKLLGF